MIEKKYFEDIIMDLKKQYPKLRFDLNEEYYDPEKYGKENDYSYHINMLYDINDVMILCTTIWIDSKAYCEDDIPRVTIDKPMLTYIDENIDKINDKYFESIGINGVEGLALVKDCANYFNKTYKKEILKLLRKEN